MFQWIALPLHCIPSLSKRNHIHTQPQVFTSGVEISSFSCCSFPTFALHRGDHSKTTFREVSLRERTRQGQAICHPISMDMLRTFIRGSDKGQSHGSLFFRHSCRLQAMTATAWESRMSFAGAPGTMRSFQDTSLSHSTL